MSLPANGNTTDPSMGGSITRSWLTSDFQALPNDQLLTVTRSDIDADSLNLRFMEDQASNDEDLGLKALRGTGQIAPALRDLLRRDLLSSSYCEENQLRYLLYATQTVSFLGGCMGFSSHKEEENQLEKYYEI